MSANSEMLDRVVSTKDFFHGIFIEDNAADWALVQEFGEYMIGIRPDDCGGHLMLARALRHLGNAEGARKELELAKGMLTGDPFASDYLPQMEREEHLLSSG